MAVFAVQFETAFWPLPGVGILIFIRFYFFIIEILKGFFDIVLQYRNWK